MASHNSLNLHNNRNDESQDPTETALLILLSFLLSFLVSICCLLCICLRVLLMAPESDSPEHHINQALQQQQTRDNSLVSNAWTPAQRRNAELSWAFEQTYPPSAEIDFTTEELGEIRERGVVAWRFLAQGDAISNVIVQDQTELVFFSDVNIKQDAVEERVCCIQTNMPIPKVQDTYYFEAKLMELPADTSVGIGLATKPYPSWRFPGYLSQNGNKLFNDAYAGYPYGVRLYEGDVLGVGYRPRIGQVFFTRNGVKMDTAYTGFRGFCVFPTLAADGPCVVEVNLGQAGFVLIEANVKKWGLAPVVEELRPPPAYGAEVDSVLLATAESSRTVRYKGHDGAPEVEIQLETTPPKYNE